MLSPTTGSRRTLLTLGLAFFGILLFRTAWVSDLAYLTLRTVEHAASGFGPRWNLADRVQVYDHPLWMLALLAGRLFSGELYFTTLAISMALSVTALWLALRPAATDLALVTGAAAAVLSPLFLTFSTSGLESPLVHALAAAFAASVLAGRSATALASLGGLLILTHWTTALIVGPVLVPLVWTSFQRTRLPIILSVLPALAWLSGAWWYYGTLGSTAHVAARSAHLSWTTRAGAGWSFFADTTRFDPLFIFVALMGVWIGFAMRGAAARLALGSALAIGCAVLGGGSEMAGRHLSAPFVIGLVLVVRYLGVAGPAPGVVALATVATLAAISPVFTLTSGADYGLTFAPEGRAADARAEHYQATGLLLESRPRQAPSHPEVTRARAAIGPGGAFVADRVPGMVGFALGRDVYVLDHQGRTDPLLARLPPAIGPRWPWEADRRIPDGYVEGLPDGAPAEAPLAELTRDLRRITRGPLTAPGRASALIAVPASVEAAIAASSYGSREVPLEIVASDAAIPVPEGGLVVRFPGRRLSRLAVTLSGSYDYRVMLLDRGRIVQTVTSPRLAWTDPSDSRRELRVSPTATATALHIRCGRGLGACTVRQVSLGD